MDIVSMKDIDRLERLVKIQGGKVQAREPGATYVGPVSYGLIEDIERAQVMGHDEDDNG